MIDTLYQNLTKLRKPAFWDEVNLKKDNYFLLTLHRPSNVDNSDKLKTLLETISYSTKNFLIIFPVHPRTRKNLVNMEFGNCKYIMTDPLGYHEFIYLVKNAKGIITDSGV